MTADGLAAVRVPLAGGSYDVLVGQGVLPRVGDLCTRAGLVPRRVHVFEDVGVPERLRDAVGASFPDARVTRSGLRLDESCKSIASLERMLVDLAEASIERTDLVVALGGGIVGDVAGLAAALHRRGVPVVQCPTTLLAMVDASVGGKTAVNLRASIDGSPVLLKNGVGAFHQPSLVVADVDALASLDSRQLRCGLAECIKHAIIAGGDGRGMLSLDEMASSLSELLAGDCGVLMSLVRQNVELKACVVSGDEKEFARGESAGRRALNLGHTFAHAIEGCEGTRVEVGGVQDHPLHGEAVGLGLIAAASFSEAVGLASSEFLASIRCVLEAAGLPTRLSASPATSELIRSMRQDKKAVDGDLRLVLPTASGVRMHDAPCAELLERAWLVVC
ncbi:MAG: 3-dehydroquinate synthase family protein [Phycisphaerales bacterium JB060]